MLRRWRWPSAIISGFGAVGSLGLLIALVNFPSDEMIMKLMMVSHFAPALFVSMAFSSLWFGFVITHWGGDPKTHLLLRLIDGATNSA